MNLLHCFVTIAFLAAGALAGCSENKAASAKCADTTTADACRSCCQTNGAPGSAFPGAGASRHCKCTN
jgi:hypothetical protein